MRYLKTYGFFNEGVYYNSLDEELRGVSPIIELTNKDKTGVILMGVPGSGKTTFINDVMNRFNYFKIFSPDEISGILNRRRYGIDSMDFHPGSVELSDSYLFKFMESGSNFVFDTTGVNVDRVSKVMDSAISKGYNMIIISVVIDRETSKKNVKYRHLMGSHGVDIDYLNSVYDGQLDNLVKVENKYPNVKSYIIDNTRKNYRYYMRDKGKLIRLYK